MRALAAGSHDLDQARRYANGIALSRSMIEQYGGLPAGRIAACGAALTADKFLHQP